jgi:hypothetical protein
MSLGTLTSITGSAGFPASGLVFMTFSSTLAFQFRHFGQAATMTLRAAESGGKKCLNQFSSERVTDYEAAEVDHVNVVVLDALVRGKSFMDQARPDARHLVSGDGCTDTASTDGHAAIHLPASDCTGHGHNKIRIIIVPLRLSAADPPPWPLLTA